MHLTLALLLWFFRDDTPNRVFFEIQLVDTQKRLSKKEVIEIKKAIDKVQKEKAAAKKNSKKAGATRLNENEQTENRKAVNPVSREERFEQDFEKTLFSPTSSSAKSIPRTGGGKAKGWEEEGRKGTSGRKTETGESIKVPDGKTGTGSFNWQGGYTRRMVYMPKIDYPLYYRKQGIQTDVLCRIEVDSSGKVVDVSVLRSSGHTKLDLMARKALRNARFSPGSSSQNDIGEVTIKFSLKN